MRTQSGLYLDVEIAQMRRRDKEMIPRRLLLAMLTLALVSLALVSFAVLTDRPRVGQPQEAAVVASRSVILEGQGQSARVMAPDGTLLLDRTDGGFIAAVRQALERERLKARIDGNPPITVARHANGRLSLHDPATGWRMELASFGRDNTAAWAPLLQ